MNYLDLISKIMKKKGINAKIDLNSNLKSIGVDSLLAMDVIVEIETLLNIRFEDSSLMNIKTAGDLVSKIEILKK